MELETEARDSRANRNPEEPVGSTPENLSFDVHHPQPLLVVISGTAGVGKDAVLKRLNERMDNFRFVVTTTSRAKRRDETHGVDYFFTTEEDFKGMIERDELIEYAYVYDHYKGVPKSQVRAAFESGMDVFMRLDVQGAARVRALFPEAVLVFIIPSSYDEWYQRLTDRRSETPEGLRVRLETARRELDCLPEFDYVVVNSQGKLEEAVDSIIAIVHAEHHRIHHRQITL